MLCGGPLSKVAFAVGGLLPKVYFGVPRPVPVRGRKGLQRGETGLRGAAGLCAATGVGAWRTGARGVSTGLLSVASRARSESFVAQVNAAQAGALGGKRCYDAALRLMRPDNMWLAQTSSKCG